MAQQYFKQHLEHSILCRFYSSIMGAETLQQQQLCKQVGRYGNPACVFVCADGSAERKTEKLGQRQKGEI